MKNKGQRLAKKHTSNLKKSQRPNFSSKTGKSCSLLHSQDKFSNIDFLWRHYRFHDNIARCALSVNAVSPRTKSDSKRQPAAVHLTLLQSLLQDCEQKRLRSFLLLSLSEKYVGSKHNIHGQLNSLWWTGWLVTQRGFPSRVQSSVRSQNGWPQERRRRTRWKLFLPVPALRHTEGVYEKSLPCPGWRKDWDIWESHRNCEFMTFTDLSTFSYFTIFFPFKSFFIFFKLFPLSSWIEIILLTYACDLETLEVFVYKGIWRVGFNVCALRMVIFPGTIHWTIRRG